MAPYEPPTVVEATFVAGVAATGSLPAPGLAEIAFAGRSNVGKSSLLNALVARRNLVRTGSTPGTTRQLNIFLARASDGLAVWLVDLPGYGFAQRSKTEKKSWGKLIEDYLRQRVTLRALVLLVDARRGVEEDDLDLVDFVERAKADRPSVQMILVATKLDKLPRSARKPALAEIEARVGVRPVGFSAETGEGRPELWARLREAVVGTP